MAILHNKIIEDCSFWEQIWSLNDSTGKRLDNWMEPFVSSLSDDGTIPYLMDSTKRERYRASPLASCLIWLDQAGFLSKEVVLQMQNALLFLRDNSIASDAKPGNNKKHQEDIAGWSLGEGVSVWSTSLAIIALIDRNDFGISNAKKYKESIIWLSNQHNVGDGWGYQFSNNCPSNVIMTSLAVWALARVLTKQAWFSFNSSEIRTIHAAVSDGCNFLRNELVMDKKKNVYWTFMNRPHCTATTWALVALSEVCSLADTPIEISDFLKLNKPKALEYVLRSMPKNIERWNDEQIVCEAGAKYSHQKNYYSFSPTLIPQLIQLGVSPFHPKIVNQIKWLLNNPKEWRIKKYDQTNICTFTYVMVIATICVWVQFVGKHQSVCYLKNAKNGLVGKIYSFILGQEFVSGSPIQFVTTERVSSIAYIAGVFFISILFGRQIFNFISQTCQKIIEYLEVSSNDIALNLISASIYSAICILGKKVGGLWKRFIK